MDRARKRRHREIAEINLARPARHRRRALRPLLLLELLADFIASHWLVSVRSLPLDLDLFLDLDL